MKRQLSGTERVHPYVEAPPLQYPSVGSYDHNHDHNHMPNDLVHKEQKEGLIEQPIVNGNEEINQEAQTPMVRRRRSRRRRCCVRCCCCMGACVGTFVVIVGILVMLFFLVLHPKLPKYTITEASISKFSMSNTTSSNSSAAIASAILGADEEGAETVYLNVEMQLRARLTNPNKKIGIDYRELSGKLIYAGVEIGEGSIPAFYQGHQNTTYVGLAMQGRDIALTPSLAKTLANTLKNEESIVLRARAIALVRIKIGHWKSHTSKVRVKCTIQLSNPTRGSVRLLHDSCKFKLLRLHL